MTRHDVSSAVDTAGFNVRQHGETRHVIEHVPVSSLDNHSIKRYNEEFMTVIGNL